MFTITEGKGFCIKFDNGWEVSIQFGPFNYCQNRCSRFVDPSIIRRHDVSCDDAEIAVFTPSGEYYLPEKVRGWQSADDVAKMITEISQKPKGVSDVTSSQT